MTINQDISELELADFKWKYRDDPEVTRIIESLEMWRKDAAAEAESEAESRLEGKIEDVLDDVRQEALRAFRRLMGKKD